MIKSESPNLVSKIRLIEDTPRIHGQIGTNFPRRDTVSYQYMNIRSPCQRIPVAACVASYTRTVLSPRRGGTPARIK